MSSWWKEIAKKRVSLGFALRIAGIPTLFASFREPTSGTWTTHKGETYDWHECISLDEIADVAVEIDPWTGAPVTSDVSIGVRLTAEVIALLDPEHAAEIKCTLMESVTASDVTWTVDDETDVDGADLLYVGTETVELDSTAAGELTISSRGVFGSTARPHFAGAANIQEFGAGGPFISTRPMVLEGRIVELWAVPMRVRDGVRTPVGSYIADIANKLIARGPLFSFLPSYGNGTATLTMQSLASLFDRDIFTRWPKASAGHGLPGYIQVDKDCCEIAFAARNQADAITATYVRRLQRDDGAGNAEDVPFGIYHVSLIGRWVGYTIEQATAKIGESREVYGAANNFGEDGATQLYITVEYTYADEWAPELVLLPSARSLWPELGFGTEQVVAGDVDDDGSATSSCVRMRFESSDPAPRFRLSERGLRRIYYTDRGEQAFSTSVYIDDASGTAVNAFVILDDELLEITDSGTVYPNENTLLDPVPYLEIGRRAALGSVAKDHTTSGDDEALEVRQVLAFPGVEWGRALLYLLASGLEWGATYSRFWRGSGAGVGVNLIDTASFLAVGNERRDVVITEKTTLRDVVSTLCPQTQTAVIADTSIRLINLDPITEDEEDTALAITYDDISGWPSYDDGRDRIVNVVNGRNLGFNPGTGEGQDLVYTQGTSVGTWGAQQAVDIDCRWAGTAEDSEAVLGQAFDRLVSKFGARFATVGLELASALKAWAVAPGDAVTITHPALPDGAGGLGMVARLARVWRVSRRYQGDGTRAQATAVIHDLDRSTGRCRWAPTARCTSLSGAVATCSSADEAAHFAAGMVCRLYERNDSTASETRTVDSVSGADITFTTSPTLTPDFDIEFTGWTYATTGQRKFAYLDRKRWS